jgi:hypothetical protein
MHQHLVHHHLEEQRRDQGEQLQHEGDQQHFAQQLAVLDHGGDEPGEVELGQFAGQGGARGEQDQLAAPARKANSAATTPGALGARVLDQDFSASTRARMKKRAVQRSMASAGRGLRSRRDPASVAHLPCALSPSCFGREQNGCGTPKRLPAFAEIVGELVRRRRRCCGSGRASPGRGGRCRWGARERRCQGQARRQRRRGWGGRGGNRSLGINYVKKIPPSFPA